MSYILEALRKSEQERRQQEASKTNVGATVGLSHSSRQPKPWKWIAIAVVGINFVVIAAVLMGSRESSKPVVVSNPPAQNNPPVVAQPQQPALQQASPARAVPQRPPAAPQPVPAQSLPQRPPQPQPQVRPQPNQNESMSLAEMAGAAPSQVSPLPAVQPQAIPAPQPPVQPVAAPSNPKAGKVIFSPVELDNAKSFSPAQMAQAQASKSSKLSHPNVPLLDELDDSFRQSVPPFNVNVHVYSDEPAERFALINMKRAHEGETLSGGLILNEITKEGFVMTFRGKTFQIEAR